MGKVATDLGQFSILVSVTRAGQENCVHEDFGKPVTCGHYLRLVPKEQKPFKSS